MNRDKAMREELVALLRGGNAHIGFDEMIADFPLKEINATAEKVTRPPDEPVTPWHLLEHMRLVQKDILEFVRDPKYVSPEYPVGYWPSPGEKADKKKWERSVRSFQSDLEAVLEIVTDPKTELLAPIPHAKDYILFREILLVADHNAYHIGQFALLQDLMGGGAK